MAASPKNSSCVECNGEESSEMAQCDKCDRWTHNACAGLSEEVLSDKVNKFYCSKCRNKFGLVHDWQKKTNLSKEEKVDKMRNYFVVDKIVGHEITATGRKFIIKWKNYSETSLEPEKNLDGCIDLLQDYCIREQLPLSEVEGLLGASAKAKFDRRNWKTMGQILDTIAVLRKRKDYRACQLPVFQFKEKLVNCGIYLVAHDFHCFVMLFMGDQKYYIADGDNKVWDDAVLEEIKELLNLSEPVFKYHYVGQSKADFCASSAVLIALELMRLHQLGRLATGDNVLRSSAWMRKTVVGQMHKYESASTSEKSAIGDANRLRNCCIHCGKKMIKNDRRTLTLHERRYCPAKQKESNFTEDDDSATEIEDEAEQ